MSDLAAPVVPVDTDSLSPTRFPIEIWEECWSYSSRRDLRNLVRVCRLFRGICRKALFHSLSFRAPAVDICEPHRWGKWTRYFSRSAIRIMSLGTDADALDLRTIVQEWDFHGKDFVDLRRFPELVDQGIGPVEEAHAAVVESFKLTLSLYSNLRTLSLSSLTIDTTVRHTLANLPKLDTLHLSNCRLGPLPGPILRLRELTLDGIPFIQTREPVFTSSHLGLFSPATLNCLTIDDANYADSSIPHLLTLGTFRHLTFLGIHVSARRWPFFFSFLELCPRLQSLAINEYSDEDSYPRILSPSIVPSLKCYIGPASRTSLFAPGRPVESVCVTDSPQVSTVIEALSAVRRSSVPLLMLSLSSMLPGVEVLEAISSYFPHLESLQLRILDPDILPRTSSSFIIAEEEDDVEPESDDDSGVEFARWEGPTFLRISSNEATAADGVHNAGADDGPEVVTMEVDGEGHTERSPTTFADLIDRIALGHAPLPSGLERLVIHQVALSDRPRPFTIPEQRSVVIKLSHALPRLTELELVNDHYVWRRYGPSWREPDGDV